MIQHKAHLPFGVELAEFTAADPEMLASQLRVEKAKYSKLQNMKMRNIASSNLMLFPSQLMLWLAWKKVPDK